jgi:hypothetical protein
MRADAVREDLTRIRTSWASFNLIVLDAAVVQRFDQPGHVVLVELGEELVAFGIVRGPGI